MKIFILISFIFFTNLLYSDQLLDEIVGVINDKSFSLSELKRVNKTIEIRKEISPLLYKNLGKKSPLEDLLKLKFQSFIIKDILSEQGYVVSDDSVESVINSTEKQLGFDRDTMIQFLESKGITFYEYFEVIRKTKELNLFMQRVISPLVSITDQDLKILYFNKYAENESASFMLNVVDYSLSKNLVIDSEMQNLKNVFTNYQKTGVIPQAYKSYNTSNLDNLVSDDLPKDLKDLFNNTGVNTFTNPIIKSDQVHLFYITKKEIIDSPGFIEKKPILYNELYTIKSEKVLKTWYQKEFSNYYILNNIIK